MRRIHLGSILCRCCCITACFCKNVQCLGISILCSDMKWSASMSILFCLGLLLGWRYQCWIWHDCCLGLILGCRYHCFSRCIWWRTISCFILSCVEWTRHATIWMIHMTYDLPFAIFSFHILPKSFHHTNWTYINIPTSLHFSCHFASRLSIRTLSWTSYKHLYWHIHRLLYRGPRWIWRESSWVEFEDTRDFFCNLHLDVNVGRADGEVSRNEELNIPESSFIISIIRV